MADYKVQYPIGTRWLWLYMALIVLGWISLGYIQMPLATPGCVPDQPDQEGYQDCAAFARFVRWIGSLIHEHHDEIIALATVVLAFFTFTLWRATNRLWQSAESQLSEFRQSLLIANKHADHVAASVKVAQATIELSRREFILAHRPRIRVKHVWLKSLVVGEPLSIDLVLVNTGYALPSLVISRFTTYLSSAPQLPERPPIPDLGHELSARAFINGHTIVFSHYRESGLTEAEYSSIMGSRERLYCMGILDYRHDLSGDGTTGGGTTAYCRVLELRRDEDGGSRFVIHNDPNYEYQD